MAIYKSYFLYQEVFFLYFLVYTKVFVLQLLAIVMRKLDLIVCKQQICRLVCVLAQTDLHYDSLSKKINI